MTETIQKISPDSGNLRIRSAVSTGQDAHFVVAAWDSTLPYLASIGSGDLWGEQSFSQREGFREDISDIIEKSEKDPENDTRRILIAELEKDASLVPVGAAMIRDALPNYILEREQFRDEIEKGVRLMYIEVLISDHRAQPRYRGVGAALIEAIKLRAVEKGKQVVYVDAFAGNERRLNRYYEIQGFESVGDFQLTRKNGNPYLRTLYRIDLRSQV